MSRQHTCQGPFTVQNSAAFCVQRLQFLMGELVMDKGWSLDQALHEMTYIRSEMAMLLPARPRMQRPAPPIMKGSGKSSPTGSQAPSTASSSAGGKKGKSKGKPKGGVKWLGGHGRWPEEAVMYEVPKWILYFYGLQVPPWLRLPKARWISMRTSASSDAACVDTPLTRACA